MKVLGDEGWIPEAPPHGIYILNAMQLSARVDYTVRSLLIAILDAHDMTAPTQDV